MELLEKPNLPDCLLQLISWVLGEYIVFVEEDFVENVIGQLIKLLSMLCKGNCQTKKNPPLRHMLGFNNRRTRASCYQNGVIKFVLELLYKGVSRTHTNIYNGAF